MNVNDFFHYAEIILNGLLALHVFALFIVNMTDTKKDDELVAKAYRAIEIVAGIVHSAKVKQ